MLIDHLMAVAQRGLIAAEQPCRQRVLHGRQVLRISSTTRCRTSRTPRSRKRPAAPAARRPPIPPCASGPARRRPSRARAGAAGMAPAVLRAQHARQPAAHLRASSARRGDPSRRSSIPAREPRSGHEVEPLLAQAPVRARNRAVDPRGLDDAGRTPCPRRERDVSALERRHRERRTPPCPSDRRAHATPSASSRSRRAGATVFRRRRATARRRRAESGTRWAPRPVQAERRKRSRRTRFGDG